MHEIERCPDCGKTVIKGDTVTITATEYEKLRRYAKIGLERKPTNAYRAVSSSKIARNPELAGFIVECASTMTVAEVAEACRRKLGDKAPSGSSIYRFVTAMKKHSLI